MNFDGNIVISLFDLFFVRKDLPMGNSIFHQSLQSIRCLEGCLFLPQFYFGYLI